MKRKQGGSDEDGPRCPPHPAFVLGRCFLCGVKEKNAEGGAPGVAVGHETLKQKQGGGGGGGDDNDQCAATEEDARGSAPRVPLAPCPSRRVLLFLGLDGTKDEGSAEGGVSDEIREGPAAVPALTTTTSTSIPRASDLETLLRARKLTLILDLDHTLLNSTALDDLSPAEQAKGFTPDRSGDPSIGLFRLDSNNVQMFVKLRPFVRGFLKQANSMFEKHVYTFGNQGYTKAAMDLLDPDGVYFGGRVVSIEKPTLGVATSLDVIPGADPVETVILDALDVTDVFWPEHQDNIILTDRYRYFASTCRKSVDDIPSLAEQGLDDMEDGGSLAVALFVLKRVHQAFFDGHRADVREVITELKGQVLRGCTVAFSYLEEFPEDTIYWTLAERLGAVCRKYVDKTVTHVVAEDPRTQKAQWARDHGKFLVNTEWIKAVSFRLWRLDERGFPVTTMGVERRHAVWERDPLVPYKAAMGLLRLRQELQRLRQGFQENRDHKD